MSLIPAPFFFHYYEYTQYIERKDAPFLTMGSILFVLITGSLSASVKVRYVFFINMITAVISVVLAILFIFDSWWFAPVGRDAAVILVAVGFLLGQLLVRGVWKAFLNSD